MGRNYRGRKPTYHGLKYRHFNIISGFELPHTIFHL